MGARLDGRRLARAPAGWSAGIALAALLLAACGGSDRPTIKDDAAASATGETATPSAAATAPLNERPQFSTRGWKTDFSRHSVPLSEISSGGPPRDGIPPIDAPKFLNVAGGDGFLKDQEPVVAFEMNGDARAYPIQILMWHEIVNDTVADVPVAVTFCPLCNTAIAFDRRLDGRALDFGTTGNLRHSDLVMWDRQTESWWQQVTGEAIVGELTGRRLTFLPAAIVSWREFKAAYPRGQVLSTDTGHERRYGVNPYAGYDDADESPFLFNGTPDKRLPPKERVVTVSLGDEDAAYPFPVLEQLRVVNDTVDGRPVVVLWQKGTVSALDRPAIAGSRDVGAAVVYSPLVDGRRLTFRADGNGFVDAETGSRWTLLGRATTGPLAGRQLEPVVSANHFWFAWAVFKPNTRVYQAP
jgi:hypothetical protein